MRTPETTAAVIDAARLVSANADMLDSPRFGAALHKLDDALAVLDRFPPEGAIRVRSESGTMGWRANGAIYMDSEPDLALMTYWRSNSKDDQEDFGVPAAGWYTANGYWSDVDQIP